MFSLSDKFQEQYARIQQQFEEWTPFEQLYASVELTKKLQLSYKYYLSQALFQVNIQQENNDMFHHTIHQANTPAILACLLSDPLDKIISTLQLYLPLVSTTTTNEKLLDSYRDVFVYLDSKLNNLLNFTYTEQQLINLSQQIKFFIQTNPCLHKFLVNIPKLTALASSTIMINKGNTSETSLSTSPSSQRHHQPLQRYPSGRLYQHTQPPAPLMNFSSEGSHTSSLCQQLIRNEASDSGVDLTDPGMANLTPKYLATQNQQHAFIARSNSANLVLTNGQTTQHNHQFVVKSSSSPTPEQSMTNRSPRVPLSAVLSEPAQSMQSYYSDFRSQNSSYSQQQHIKPTLTVSDEDDQESQDQQNYGDYNKPLTSTISDCFSSDMNTIDNSIRLRQFISLRKPNSRNQLNGMGNNQVGVSAYLGVDGDSGSVCNTFIQPNSGMRDVPKWLKNLRLHKYAFFFSQMKYEKMMNLTIDQLKDGKITDGACTKILLNIKKLKERQLLLQQCLIDMDNGQIDLITVLQQLNELMLTPIRSKQTENDTDNDENLPKLIMQVLEKVYHQLTSNTSSTSILSDMCNNLVGLFDRCYKHEAFSPEQRHTLLHWRGPLCNKLQTSGKIEFKSMQSSASLNRRVPLKQQTSMGNMNTTQITKPAVRNIKSTLSYYPNYQSSAIPLSRQNNSESANLNGNNNNNNNNLSDSNIIRRPTKSPTLVFTTNDDPNDDSTSSSHHLSIVSSHSLQEQSSYHQTAPFITERSGNGSGNLRPSLNYITSTPHRNNNGYLAANRHQLLSRKTSIDPYGESNGNDKPKLCKTYSDPNKLCFYSPPQMSNVQSSSSTHASQVSTHQSMFQVMSAPYPQRQYLSRSHPSPINTNHAFDSLTINESPIHKCFSDREASVFYENDNNDTTTSSSNDNNTHDVDKSYSLRHNSTEFDTFCRQITESAICDDVHESSIDHKEELLNIPNTNNSTDTE